MPKRPNTQQIKLVSTADTGYFYVTFKNPKNTTEKMEKKKYDPVAPQARPVQGSEDQIAPAGPACA